jgi:excisionase family DNA binding protein
MADELEQWLTIPEVALRLRFSERTIQRYIRQGLFDPVLRTGRSVRIALARVQEYERAHLVKDGLNPLQ